ncbi:MAG: ABC transporter permease [Lachnospiraceae bacterium]|nr:ABC transporter permease [Lachnospiraceae bacterium]
MVLYMHEMKMNLKSLVIWTICVGGLCFGCILLYTSLEDSIQEIADVYSNMGSMSVALGMDKMSLATLTGFYATEIAMMHGLGGAMFAAILGTGMLSKEEAGHTTEFLNVLPMGRSRIFSQKYLAIVSNIVIFNLVCFILYILGFLLIEGEISGKEIVLYHFAQLVMQIELATVCFMISAFTKKNLMGAGLGLVILMFAADMMCRIIPAIEDVKYITPFYYSNAADIFTEGSIDNVMLGLGLGIIVITFMAAGMRYGKKDFAV